MITTGTRRRCGAVTALVMALLLVCLMNAARADETVKRKTRYQSGSELVVDADVPVTGLTKSNDSRIASVVTPQMFGAFADGATHAITSGDITAHTEWRGTYAAGDTWDFVGLQEAIYAAFGGPAFGDGSARAWHNTTNYMQNKRLVLPNGQYRINKMLRAIGLSGFEISGSGKRNSVITQDGVNLPHIYFDGVSYGTIKGIGFVQGGASTEAQVEIDWTGAYATLKPQQITVADCFFDGNYSGAIGVRIAKSGGAAQGDTIIFSNCYWQAFTAAGLQLGTPTAYAYNALSVMVHGGNMQACFKYGVAVYGGSILVDGTNFENQPAKVQIDRGGSDVYKLSSPGSVSVLRNVRSESAVLSNGFEIVENCDTHAVGIDQWGASTAVTASRLLYGSDGRPYIVVQAGTTGASEPNWSAIADAGVNVTSIAAGSTSMNGGGPYYYAGQTVAIAGAGPAGADLITTVAAVDSASEFTHATLATAASTTVSNAPVRWGAAATDGTAKLLVYNFEAASGALSLRNCALGYGRVQMDVRHGAEIINNHFTRADYLRPTTLVNEASSRQVLLTDSGNVVSDQTFTGPSRLRDSVGGRPVYSFHNMGGSPLIWRAGAAGLLPFDVGVDRGDETFSTDPATIVSRSVLAVIGTLGKITKTGTNAAGEPLVIQGGLGTGNGGGGSIRFQTQAAGASGTAVANAIDRGGFDASGNFDIQNLAVGSLVKVNSSHQFVPAIAGVDYLAASGASYAPLASPNFTGTLSLSGREQITAPAVTPGTTNDYALRVVSGADNPNGSNQGVYIEAGGSSVDHALTVVGPSSFTGPVNLNGSSLTNVSNFAVRGVTNATNGTLRLADTSYSGAPYGQGRGGNLVLAGFSGEDDVPAGRAVFASVQGVKENATYLDSRGALILGTQSGSWDQAGLSSVSEKMRIPSDGGLRLKPQTQPATPPTNHVTVYASSVDGKLHAVDSAGVDHALW